MACLAAGLICPADALEAKNGSAAWCREALVLPVKSPVVSGTLAGQPFKCETAMWNSYSLTFKQNTRRYAKVVVNMMESRKRFFGLSFDSDSHKNTQIFVYTRTSMKAKVEEKRYKVADGCAFKVVLEPEHLGHVVPGTISLRLPDGSSISGKFVAVKAPRMIWDDEEIRP
jgi:hypothetical protein